MCSKCILSGRKFVGSREGGLLGQATLVDSLQTGGGGGGGVGTVG
jgi:hypothetical protein